MNTSPPTPQQPKLKLLEPAAPEFGQEWDIWRAFRGQLWCEWYAHSRLLLFFLAAWLAGVWIMPLYIDPAWILLFGGIFAGVAGPLYGGSDTLAGCEEQCFASPPTRGERFVARFAVGAGALVLFTAMDMLALGLDLPQILAKVYVQSGLIHPSPAFQPALLNGLVITLPFAVFAIAFVIACLARSRGVVLSASLWALSVALGVLRLGFWYEDILWERPTGYFACPLLLLVAGGSAWVGFHAYRRKEVNRSSSPFAPASRWWLWGVLFCLSLVLALALAASLALHYAAYLPGR